MRLALGTVQFGRDYGPIGGRQVPPAEASEMLERAAENGIDTLDTAATYGTSETVIGAHSVRHRFRVVTKVPELDNRDPVALVERAVEHSLERLRIDRLHGVLVHHAADLLGASGDRLWGALESVRDQGIVQHIGASVYRPHELELLRERYDLGLVQAPLSLLDQRLLETDLLSRLHNNGTAIHVRSVFLQGLLPMPEDRRPAWTAPWQQALRACDAWAARAGLSRIAACVRFALSQPEVDRVVVGAHDAAQLQEILDGARSSVGLPPAESLACHDEQFLHPYKWPQ